MLEALIAGPCVIAVVTLALGGFFALGAGFVVQDRLDETLLCLSFQSRDVCEAAWKRTLREASLAKLDVEAKFLRNGTVWEARAKLRLPWGQRITLSRELKTPLTEN